MINIRPLLLVTLAITMCNFFCSAANVAASNAVGYHKRLLTLASLYGVISVVGCIYEPVDVADIDVFKHESYQWTIFIYFLQCMVFLAQPFVIFNFLGIVLFSAFTTKPKLEHSPLVAPFLCFRVITRGLYPQLVNDNVQRNIQICNNAGLHRYIFQVVTDVPVGVEEHSRSHEVVVPIEYRTPSGALYKARALQYSLEPGVDILKPGDWVVHLDEETVLTEDAVIGVLNFVGASEHSFGQGVITYGHGNIVNWITTLADSVRVGIDYGYLRFSLGVLHKPVFSWKGSFIVADAEAEKDVSFDHGFEGSIAEDCFFGCLASSKGYSFGFVDGQMREKSTFTLNDFIWQRHRWMHGILLTALSKNIPLQYKIGPVLMSLVGCSLPFNIILFIASNIWPLPSSNLTNTVYTFTIGTMLYLFILGTIKTFPVKHHGLLKVCFLVVATVFCAIISTLLETIASVFAYWIPNRSKGFYVVNKQIHDQNDNYETDKVKM